MQESLHLILIIILQSRHFCLPSGISCKGKKKGVFEGKKKKGANYRLLVPCHLPALLLLINDLMTLVNIIRNACRVGSENAYFDLLQLSETFICFV